ncbi:MAG: hypothetical protein IT536_05990 [Hyphomicrobiales bacterium]|nr:hypothetical protein [Hyphomicrobiales bacterium]
MLDPNSSDNRRDVMRETDREGLGSAAWAGIAFAAMVIGGLAMFAFLSGDSTTTTATRTQPAVERSQPPATTGQGDTQTQAPSAK